MPELISYPTRKAAIAALIRFRKNPDVTLVELIENGRTLRVTGLDEIGPDEDLTVNDEPLTGENPDAEQAGDDAATEESGDVADEDSEQAGDGAAEAEEALAAPVETQVDDDLLGDSPQPEDLLGEFDISNYTRKQLSTLIAERGLDIEVPASGPLADVREKITAALVPKE